MEHPRIYAGVDTHSDTHTLALIDEYGRPLATQTFMADPTGYERLAAMIGDPDACLGVGVEGTNSYGAALTRRLVEAGYNVYEVLRPKRAVRRRDGKSDPVDALAAARSVLAGDGTSVPKSTDGWVEALRALNAERAQPVTATAALSNSAKGLPATAPEHIRERYRDPGHRRRGQPRTHPQRGRVRQALRRLPHPRLQRQDQPAPAQQRRQPAGQLRPAPHRHRPHALPPAHPRLRESEDRGRQRQDAESSAA